MYSFFILSFWAMHMLYSEHISVHTSHISRAQWPQMAIATVLDGLEVERCSHVPANGIWIEVTFKIYISFAEKEITYILGHPVQQLKL